MLIESLPESTVVMKILYTGNTVLEFDYKKKVHLHSPADKALSYLGDIKAQVESNFPGIESIEEALPDTLIWNFEKFEIKGTRLSIECHTRTIHGDGQVAVEALPARGNGNLSATWKVMAEGTESILAFKADFRLDLDIPFWLRALAVPIASAELRKLFDRYLSNVESALR